MDRWHKVNQFKDVNELGIDPNKMIDIGVQVV